MVKTEEKEFCSTNRHIKYARAYLVNKSFCSTLLSSPRKVKSPLSEYKHNNLIFTLTLPSSPVLNIFKRLSFVDNLKGSYYNKVKAPIMGRRQEYAGNSIEK